MATVIPVSHDFGFCLDNSVCDQGVRRYKYLYQPSTFICCEPLLTTTHSLHHHHLPPPNAFSLSLPPSPCNLLHQIAFKRWWMFSPATPATVPQHTPHPPTPPPPLASFISSHSYWNILAIAFSLSPFFFFAAPEHAVLIFSQQRTQHWNDSLPRLYSRRPVKSFVVAVACEDRKELMVRVSTLYTVFSRSQKALPASRDCNGPETGSLPHPTLLLSYHFDSMPKLLPSLFVPSRSCVKLAHTQQQLREAKTRRRRRKKRPKRAQTAADVSVSKSIWLISRICQQLLIIKSEGPVTALGEGVVQNTSV